MRKTKRLKKAPLPDVEFRSYKVAKFVNHLMYSGKKSLAFNIFYSALEKLKGKFPDEQMSSIEIWKQAVDNVSPIVEVRHRRVGGATFQVPTEISPKRRETISMKNMIFFARKRAGKSMSDKLASEILDAFNKQGGAYKKKEDMHKMAEANKAFAYFRF
ncbi:MAG: 30S ribosomal protein S7 [Bacteroidales bacterium OttesenSCG-928-I14]|jgi:small subunit ribosomal protein S7|nr:30S ribosomal protein S7 [Bacteroidales bacterium OttesenSCG-928-I14]